MTRISLLLILPWLLQSQSTLQVDVDLVNVFATVQDDEGRYVGDLTPEDFRVFEDDEERPIEIFETTDDLFSSIGVLIDNSGSSADILGSIRSGVEDFSNRLTSEDEIFVMSFAIDAQVVHDFDAEADRLGRALGSLRAWGTSVLFDALYSGINEATAGKHERKALIVLSDGNDNQSEKSYREVVQAAQSNMILLYFVGLGPPILIDRHTMEGLASMTGGRVVLLDRDQPVAEALEQIRQELGHQYYLGYHASSEQGFHSIRVEVPERDVTVRARAGYLVR